MDADKVLTYLLIVGAVLLIIGIVRSDIRFKKSMDLLDEDLRKKGFLRKDGEN